jgi:hypothetical protein
MKKKKQGEALGKGNPPIFSHDRQSPSTAIQGSMHPYWQAAHHLDSSSTFSSTLIFVSLI